LKNKISSAGNDDIFNQQLVYACGYWVIRLLETIKSQKLLDNDWVCPSGPIDEDGVWKSAENNFRPKILSRLEAFIEIATKTKQFPHFCNASQKLFSKLQKEWPKVKSLKCFPVFSDKI
jgi:hypothetical protein